MGRPSKLTPAQWAEIERRLLGGETARALAAEFQISVARISERFPKSAAKAVHAVAQKLAEAHDALDALPVPQQATALTWMEQLRRIGENVTTAALYGADTGRRVAEVANQAARELVAGDVDGLKLVAAASRTANEAMAPAIQLLTAREKLQTDKPDGDAVPTSGVLMVPGLAADPEAWAKGAKAG